MMKLFVYLASKGHGLLRNGVLDCLIELFIETVARLKLFGDWKTFSERYVQTYESFEPSRKFINNPENFLEGMAIVLTSPTQNEKGVILVAYNYAFPTFALIFDLPKIMERYHIVLEPSTARYLMPEILMFKGVDEKVFVETGEPRDARFLKRFMRNAVSIPIAANWWIDSRIFTENPHESKKYDLIMVSSWLRLKRHELLFQALGRLKNRGLVLSCVLVGYPIDMTKEEILALARKYQVDGQIEMFEWLSQRDVALLYQRSKLNLLLSKREGFNRSIIEGMYCNVPCLIREGFNFGHRYEYMNEKTGGYFTDGKLDVAIENALHGLDKFEPRHWIIENGMTAQNASLILEKEIFGSTEGRVAVKTSGLNGMEYWEESDRDKFASDYRFLLDEACRSQVRGLHSSLRETRSS